MAYKFQLGAFVASGSIASDGGLDAGDANVTNVGNIALDSISADGNDIDVSMTDQRAEAFQFKEGSNAYLTFKTTNGSERMLASQHIRMDGSKQIQFDGGADSIKLDTDLVFNAGADISLVPAGGDVKVTGAVSGSGNLSAGGSITAGNSNFTVSSAGAVVAVGVNAGGALSGATTIAASGLASLDGGINVNDDFTVDIDGGVVCVGLNAGGAITGATTIAASSNATIEGVVSGAAGTFDALSGTSLALQSGGISAAGAIAGASTVSGSGLASSGQLNSGQGNFTVSALGVMAAGASTVASLNASSGGITNAGAIAGATTIAMGGALSGVTTIAASSNATIEGIVSGAAGTFDALSGTSLALQGGGISAAGAIAGASTISGSGAISGHELDIEAGANIAGAVSLGSSLTVAGDLYVQGSQTYVSSSTLWVTSSITFEGTANAHETTLGIVDPTADRDVKLADSAGVLVPFAVGPAAGTQITASPAELNLLDAVAGSSVALASGDGLIMFDASDSNAGKKVLMSDIRTFIQAANIQNVDDGGTLQVGFNYFADFSGASEDCSLPASPTVGNIVYLKAPSNCSSTHTLTVNRAGSHTIDGSESLVLESPHAAISLCYVAADLWKIF